MLVQKIIGDTEQVLGVIGCDPAGAAHMLKKSSLNFYLIKDMSCAAANILKQDALSIGAELAVNMGVVNASVESTNALLFATDLQLNRLIEKEHKQPFGLQEISAELKKFVHIKRFPVKIMGILNVNGDSFNAASRVSADDVLKHTEQMIAYGAEIIDIGAVSSRPGSAPISAIEELDRIQPALDNLYKHNIHTKTVLSLDSYQPTVIRYALDRGFKIVNDITGGENQNVIKLAAEYDAALCIMHMQNNQTNMQDNPTYGNVVDTVDAFFTERIEIAKTLDVKDIILDVGIGFGKTKEHNLQLIKAYSHFRYHGYPLLIGCSRKSVINDISKSAVTDRLPGTLALHLMAISYGASIVRCHDVFEHNQAIKVYEAFNAQSPI